MKISSLIKVAIRVKDLKEDSNTDKVLKSALISRINVKPHKLTKLEKELSLKLKLTDKEKNIDNLLDRIVTSKGLSQLGGSTIGGNASYGLLGTSLGVLTLPIAPGAAPVIIPISKMVGGIAGSVTGRKLNNSIRDSYVKKHLDTK